MASDREKEREAELESAMYTNCLLLGLDPAVIGGDGAPPRMGLFRHSNPKLGEQLLHFLLSALRGPHQAAKDFDKVWPIFDSAQSRDFRKIVQGIISELESQGALPRSNSRVSSLATCCGPRFVELLWQLSVHALREVHKRTFSADVASNPLPASLTDVSYLHAAALLPVTKARIALERRRFLNYANTAVHRQATWSSLANEITAEFRGLCAEEAYLQQELEKLQDMRNKAKLEGELWDERISSSNQNSPLVSKATRLWESLLARRSQHEVLASGPIEDLIAHREHRYRISGSSLIAAMDLSSHVPYSDVLSIRSGEVSPPIDNRSQTDSPHSQGSSESHARLDDRGGRIQTVDVAEVLRRWTHALQRIHKKSLHLAKANDGEGPELLRNALDSGSSSHAESLVATLAEHQQHLVSIQGLINQLKEAVPAMQKSISELTEEVNAISPIGDDGYATRSISPVQAQNSGRHLENSFDKVGEISSKLSHVQLEKVSSSPALKLPQLFSLTPNSSGKAWHTPKRSIISTQSNLVESLPARKFSDRSLGSDRTESMSQDDDASYIQNLKKSVREAALSKPPSNTELVHDRNSDDGSEHFFIPVSAGLGGHKEFYAVPNQTKQSLVFSRHENCQLKSSDTDQYFDEIKLVSALDASNFANGLYDFGNQVNSFQTVAGLDFTGPVQRTYSDDDQALSPPLPLLMDTFTDAYEDLLAPLSETDAALMER